MVQLDLHPFGFPTTVEVHGTVEALWSGGKGLIFLFGENHRDREMKRLYVENACMLVDRGIVGCAGTEILMADLDGQPAEFIELQSRGLFETQKTDGSVMDELSSAQPWWYGTLEFGSTLRVLRPQLPVCCVEDTALREQMKMISDAYILADVGVAPHSSPEYPHMGDHPLNLEREQAMIDHLLAVRDSKAPNLAAILNTGSAHSKRIAAMLRERGINYIYIALPAHPPAF